jgi:hypothetical protein
MTSIRNVITFSGRDVSTKCLLFKPLVYTKKIKVSARKVVPRRQIKSSIFYINTDNPLKKKHENVPTLVRGTYTDDINIIKIHEAVRTIFENDIYNIDSMEQQILILSNKLKTDFLSLIDSEKISNEILLTRKKIESLRDNSKWNSYISRAESILLEYCPLASEGVKNIIRFSDVKKEKENITVIKKRLSIIKSYLKIAEEYLPLDITLDCSQCSGYKCPGCDSSDIDEFQLVSDGMAVCKCGHQEVTLVDFSTFKDSSRVNVSGRSDYEDKSTFIKAFDQFMGERIPHIPDRLYEMLDDYFIKKKFYTGEQIREMDIPVVNNKKNITSVNLLVEALSATGNSAYYNYINYIGSIYWGWILDDLSHLRDFIMHDYDITQKVYIDIKERESSLNVQIRLFLHLKARGYKCKWSDFKTINNRASLEYHHRMWRIICDKTGVLFTPII